MTEDLSTPEQVQADLCLKFPDEAAAFATLYGAGDEPKLIYTASIDTIGVIYQPIGDMDAEGNFLTAALPGWHVNLRGVFTEDQLAELAEFVVTPEAPVRVWA
jgi:hypothetical protein